MANTTSFPVDAGDEWNATTLPSSRSRGDVVEIRWSALGLGVIVVGTAFGNILLCLAVLTERRLQNMTNYFLTSLAVADLMVALLVMPLGLVVELFGYFPLGPSACVAWATADVLLCTASIWHMATMSVDRYVSIRFPLKYNGRARTRATVVARIAFVWIVSVLICAALPVSGIIDFSAVYSPSDRQCVPARRDFVVYGSIFAFYVPLLIMIVTYALTILRLRRNGLALSRFGRLSQPEGVADCILRPAVVMTAASAAVMSSSRPSLSDHRKEDSSGPHHQLPVPSSSKDAKSINGRLSGSANSASAERRQVPVDSLAVVGRTIGQQATRSSPLPFSDCCSSRMANSDDGARDAEDDDTESDTTPEKHPSESPTACPPREGESDVAQTGECRSTRRVDVDFSSVRSTLPSSCGLGLPDSSISGGSGGALRRLSGCIFRDRGDGEMESPLLSEDWPTMERCRGDMSTQLIDHDNVICGDSQDNSDDEDVVGGGDNVCMADETGHPRTLTGTMTAVIDCDPTPKSSGRRHRHCCHSPDRIAAPCVDKDRVERVGGRHGNENVDALSRTQPGPPTSCDSPRQLHHVVQPSSRWVASNKIGCLLTDQRVGVTVHAGSINVVDGNLPARELDTECCSLASSVHHIMVQSQTKCSAVGHHQLVALDDDRLSVHRFEASSSLTSSVDSPPVDRRRSLGVPKSATSFARPASASVVVVKRPTSSLLPIQFYSIGTNPPTPTNRRQSVASTSAMTRRQSSRQSRASRVLGVMFTVFVILWSPFFIVNLVRVACSEDHHVDGIGFVQSTISPSSAGVTGSGGGDCVEHGPGEVAMASIVWLGYTSSLANPLIYTIFSASFRAAFYDILTCRRHRTSTPNRHRFQIQRREITTVDAGGND